MTTKTMDSIYVAPNGLDSNPGTEELPVGTLDEALSRTRAMKSEAAAAKRIIVRGGHYYDVSLTLNKEDAGLQIVAYPQEKPILFGGAPVTSWQRDGDWLTTPIAGVYDRELDFRLIEVDGTFRQRSRLPEQGAFRHLNEFKVEWLSTFAGGWKRPPTDEEMMALRVKREDVSDWLDIRNAELTIYHEWDESLVGVAGIRSDNEEADIRFLEAPGHPPGAFYERNANARTYVVWNVREGLKQPGQWYLDRSNEKLVYWPLPGEEMDRIQLIVPSKEHILCLEPGTRDVRFEGLTFACAATPLTAGGFGAIAVSAAIHGEDVQKIVFDRVTVRNTGGWAFNLSGKEIHLHECHIHHTGAGGIRWKGEEVRLERSRIHDIGLTYQSSIAVNSDGTNHTLVHNEIYNTPYSGIASSSPNTVISGNLLYNTMQFMKDGSAIYVCWYSDNVTVSGNAVFAAYNASEKIRRYAYYLDEKCTNCSVQDNLAVNLGVPMLSHMTRDCSFENNVFMDQGLQVVSVLNSSGTRFERNILLADAIEIHTPQGNPEGLISEEYDSHPYMSTFSASDGIVSFRNNMLFSRKQSRRFKRFFHYKAIHEYELQELEGNVFAAPILTGAAEGDYSFDADSLAWSRGIRPLSFDTVGCTGRFAEVYEQFNGNLMKRT
ncbi:right-handed parallel beta-helix repeat-containing protein [Paenibacillus lignilyticus]|uniref:Right-handed parallel beta-helix repeat-containing protein n=1 Tax=Paenibacillus lignilyticus TaxID=1172615 RepID=A0ABS5CD23_9BACL|nr:right-handed parallel beta-helix repeat-containing protein [Paenibacillus lignilyticus]